MVKKLFKKMKLELIRKIRNEQVTIGELYINGKYFSDTLEDVDRGLTEDDNIAKINKIKIMGRTAIPTGTYYLVMDMSSRFKKIMPHILDVPGFQGIRIHAGNTDKDTEGCPLLGTYNNDGLTLRNSRVSVDAFYSRMNNNKEVVTIKIS
jgi:hypothetical protein